MESGRSAISSLPSDNGQRGGIAQLGERLHGMQEVRGSSPLASTTPPEMVYLYILHSERIGRFYVGHSADVEDRLERHNAGRSKATRAGKPWTLVHTEGFGTRSEACAREAKIKSWKSAQAIRDLIGN